MPSWRFRHPAWNVLSLFGALLIAGYARSDEPAPPIRPASKNKDAIFLRLHQDEDGQLVSLQSAIATYRMTLPTGEIVHVDLLSAVHVADQSYFDQLNQRFASYDSVLYELVAESDVRPSADEEQTANGVVSWMQGGMKEVLGLEFQLDKVDYTRKNFVHADFSPSEFAQVMDERGESFAEMLFRAVGRSMAAQEPGGSAPSDLEILTALFSSQRELRLKRIMARQLAATNAADFWDGPQGSTLITERNKKAIRVLEDQIKVGKRRLAIFYGAGHMDDFHRRLTERFGFQADKTTWLTAWNLKTAPSK